ncbi:MAG: ExbD/TolR family protein [Flavisolibacter sp.]|jgi:biopolymer transport protein ExbD
MADIDVSGGDSGHKKSRGVKKAKKLSTRVDMTPMVDLGFLLITFFIFTTTMSTPSTMSLNMPKKVQDEKQLMEIKASNALTLMIGRENRQKRAVYYYMGQLEADGSNFKTATFDEIRKIIIDKRKEVMDRYTEDPSDTVCMKNKEIAKEEGDPNWQNACRDKDFVVVIKPTKEARYASTIDLLDEMTINGVKAFALVDILPQENELVEKAEKSNGLR